MLTESDLKPLNYQEAHHSATEVHGRSYWGRVASAFVSYKTGLVSLIAICLLLAFSFLGELLWNADPNIQNYTQRFLGPTSAKTVLIEPDYDWQGPVAAVDEFTIHSASSVSVKLQWPDAKRRLELYRYGAEGESPLLIYSGLNAWYEDRFDLTRDAYRYELLDEAGAVVFTQLVEPKAAVSEFYAQLVQLKLRPDNTSILTAHPLGTDGAGRDVLARLIHGGKITLTIGILAPLLATIFGTVYGAVSGYVGGRIDEVLMRFADFVIALPFLLFVILLNVALGYGPASSGVVPMFVALVVMGWPNAAKLVRGQTLLLRETEYINAARQMGAGSLYIVRTHILPAVLGAVLIALSYAIPSAIFTEALLSFIGLGVKAPEASWGSLCQEAIGELQRHPQLLLYPAGLISLTVLAFNLLGDSLRDAIEQGGGRLE